MTGQRCIAFDLDGTLLDSVADIATALNGALFDVLPRHARLPLTEAHVRRLVGTGARRLIAGALHDILDGDLDPQVEEKLYPRFLVHYERSFDVHTAPYPGVVQALVQLADDGFMLGVATNKPGAFARALVQKHFPGLFGSVLGPDDVGVAKPDPTMLFDAARGAGGALSAYVGDSSVDVEAARRAEVPLVAVSWGLGEPSALTGAHVTRVESAGQMVDALRHLMQPNSV